MQWSSVDLEYMQIKKILFIKLRVLLTEFDYSLRDNQGGQNGQLSLSRRPHTLSFLLFYTEHAASHLEAAVRNEYSPEPF